MSLEPRQGNALEAEAGAQHADQVVAQLLREDAASQALGIEILEVAFGRVALALRVRADMVNGFGMCHGGIVFALADSAFAFACNSYGTPMVAAGASIEFLAPASLGERLIATAVEVMRGPRYGIYDVAVRAADGSPLAHFRGRCARYRSSPAAASIGGER